MLLLKLIHQTPQSCHHIETSQLIYRSNQLTGFCMVITLAFNELSNSSPLKSENNSVKTVKSYQFFSREMSFLAFTEKFNFCWKLHNEENLFFEKASQVDRYIMNWASSLFFRVSIIRMAKFKIVFKQMHEIRQKNFEKNQICNNLVFTQMVFTFY